MKRLGYKSGSRNADDGNYDEIGSGRLAIAPIAGKVCGIVGLLVLTAGAAAPDKPPPRAWHAFTANGEADAAKSRLYLFGGSGADFAYLNDLWSYDHAKIGGNKWQFVSPGKTSPGPRGHAGWSCGAGQCVLSNGTNGLGNLKETWFFTAATSRWSKLNCKRTLCPSRRIGPAMAYDPANANHVLFGGGNGVAGMNDTFTFANGAWSRHEPQASPPARDRAALAHVPEHGVILFGGQRVNQAALNDIHRWDGANWSQINPQPGAAPPGLHSHSMVWLPGTTELIVAGGYIDVNDTPNTDVWSFTLETRVWQRKVLACVGGTLRPGARMALAVDTTAKKVFFGGEESVGNTTVRYDDLVICD